MAVRRSQTLRRAILIVTAALTAAGCGDLSAIRDFAGVSAGAATYREIVDEYAAFGDATHRLRPAGASALEERKEQAEELQDLHTALVNYMSALGDLAADDLVNVGPDLTALGGQLSATSLLTQAQTQAAVSLADLVVTAALDGWRRSKLRDLIETSNDDVQTVVGALESFVRDVALEDDAEERLIYQGFLNSFALQSRDPAARAALDELEIIWNERVNEEEAIKLAYLEILREIADGHQALYDNRNDLSLDQFVSNLRGYSGRIRAAFSAIRAL